MLELVALGSLIYIGATLLFGAIVITGIPHQLAVERNHPHQDAIYFAGWVSLFTLHSIWPLLWIWAAAYRRPDAREIQLPVFAEIDEDTAINDKAPKTESDDTAKAEVADDDVTDSIVLLGHRYEALDDRVERIEKAIQAAGEAA